MLAGDAIDDEHRVALRALPVKPSPVTLRGGDIDLVPYDEATHASALFHALSGAAALGHPAYDANEKVWQFMAMPAPDLAAPPPPPLSEETFARRIRAVSDAPDRTMFVVVQCATNAVVGTLSLMSCRPLDLVVEIGFVAISPAFQGTPVAMHASFLLLRHAFTVGFRRVEWKTNALHVRSQACAARIGFTFEGVFRNHMIVSDLHGNVRSRDTWWASMIVSEWAAHEERLERWLCGDAAAALYERRRAQLEALRQAAEPAGGASP